MGSGSKTNSEASGMRLAEWLAAYFSSFGETAEEKAEKEQLVRETYRKVEEVSKLREEVLEGRNFPIAGYLRGKDITQVRRTRGQ